MSPVVLEAAQLLGMDASRDRARFMAELTRLLYSVPEGRSRPVALIRAQVSRPRPSAADSPVVVPVPLTADLWSREIFGRTVPPGQLVAAIAADRRASLLCHTLAGLDDETLAYLIDRPEALRRIYERDAVAFAAFGVVLQVSDGRVLPPGGVPAVPLWEAAVGRSVAEPDAFIDALFSLHAGHLAYLFDLVAQVDDARARFILGTWLPNASDRIDRFVALSTALANSYEDWDVAALPFSRPLHDFTFVVTRLSVDSSGRPLPPAARAFWSSALDVSGAVVEEDGPVDAAWLAEATGGGDYFWRRDRVDQFGFGQRVFGGLSRDDQGSAITAIRAFPRQQMLMLALERMGIRSASLYAEVAERGARAASLQSERSFWTLAQLQGALAIVSRLTLSGSVSVATAERLVQSIIRIEFDDDGRYGARLADWVGQELRPVLPRRRDAEEQLVWGLAGPSPGAAARRLLWEGQQYVVDIPSAERKRLVAVRAKQAGATVDLALAVREVLRQVTTRRPGRDQVRAAALAMNDVLDRFSPRLAAAGSATSSRGAVPLNRVIDEATRLRDELAAAASGDPGRLRQSLPGLSDLLESLLGEALLSWAYAIDIGHPGGMALLARNIALRHDFGAGRIDRESRLRTPWSVPHQDFLPGVPWHVSGSALGLDLALASLALRLPGLDRIAQAPRLPSNERELFPVGVALVDPGRLRDGDRDVMAAAMANGRGRVEAVARGDEPFGPVARAIGMDGWRRRAIRWMLKHDQEAIPSMFALVDLLVLGGAVPSDFDSWGGAGYNWHGCVCTKLTSTRDWRLFSGRRRIGLMAALVSDLNLRVAAKLAELQVPSELAKLVLAAAVLEFVESVAPTDPNDWLSLSRFGQQVSREQIEDFVAAAAAVDGPLVPYELGATGVP